MIPPDLIYWIGTAHSALLLFREYVLKSGFAEHILYFCTYVCKCLFPLLIRGTTFPFLAPCKHIGKNLLGEIGKDILVKYFRVKQQSLNWIAYTHLLITYRGFFLPLFAFSSKWIGPQALLMLYTCRKLDNINLTRSTNKIQTTKIPKKNTIVTWKDIWYKYVLDMITDT